MKQEKNIWEQSRVELLGEGITPAGRPAYRRRMRRIVWQNTEPMNCTPASKRVFCRSFWGSLRIFWC